MQILNKEYIYHALATIEKSYQRGWNERNGGNFSYQLTPEEANDYEEAIRHEDQTANRAVDLPFDIKSLANCYFLVTATGAYFDGLGKRYKKDLGIIKINKQGTQYTIIAGYENGSSPTSELPTHLLTHATKQKTTDQNRVVYHCHPPAIVSLSFILPHNSARWTREIWDVMAECAVVIPEGIGVLPWYVPGSAEIGIATSKLMTQHDLVVWAHHGVFCAGPNPREAFSKVDVFEKAAAILGNVIAMGGRRNTIPNEEIRKLGKAFKVKLWEPALDINLLKLK